ncbi:MAG: ABC transporter substrate-binding protein [Methylobacillus sp.]|jgi:phospholipid transport system substrate-binding protein|nr:ABC transporter substrate-binding protein [Methylobacillus sp.]
MKQLINLIVGIAALTLMASATAAGGNKLAPDVLVKTTADDVLAIIKNDKDIQSGDTKKIGALAEAKILPNFDFDQMSRMVLGKYWNQASADQQQQFVQQFRTLLVRTYSSALAKYRNQTIEYKPFRGQPEDTRVTVKTQIIQSGAQPLAIDYSLLKESDGSWKVYDVVIEGVSLVTNYRSQFANEVKQNGMDALIKRLADKNNK